MKVKANVYLLAAAVIWGFALAAQRFGMNYIGPFTFTGVRFALGGISLLPVIYVMTYRKREKEKVNRDSQYSNQWIIGSVAGIILFVACSLQQIGLIYTTAGKAAFLTCLYIVLVPIVGAFLGQVIRSRSWCGSFIAIAGVYCLAVKEGWAVSYGDVLVLVGALFWTAHIIFIDYYSSKIDILQLAFWQFSTCSMLSMITAAFFEEISLHSIILAAVPILYCGIGSVGIAYTLQIVGQRCVSSSHAAIILSSETIFAALGGYLFLGERLGQQEIVGASLMLAGMTVSQWQGREK